MDNEETLKHHLDCLRVQGERMIRMGEAIKNPLSTVYDLAVAALACGCRISITLEPTEEPEAKPDPAWRLHV